VGNWISRTSIGRVGRGPQYVLVYLVAAVCVPVQGETIRLTDGSTVIGPILKGESSHIVIRSGFCKRRIAKADVAKPDANAVVLAQQAEAAKDYATACDLLQQYLIWRPADTAAREFWRRVRNAHIRGLLHKFHWRAPTGAAMAELKTIVTEDDLPLLHDALANHGNSRGRRHAAALLGFLGSQASVDLLKRRLREEEHDRTRRTIAHVLGDIGSAKAVAELVRVMRSDRNIEVRASAGDALNKIANPTALRAIRDAARKEEHYRIRAQLEQLVENPGFKRHERPKVGRGATTVGHCHGTRYLLHVPTTYDPQGRGRVVVWIHGTRCLADTFERCVTEDAEKYGCVVLAPQFNQGQYPHFGSFNVGLCPLRADLRLLEIIDEVGEVVHVDTGKFILFGHSEGGQFVNRFVLAHPDRIGRAAAAGCGDFVHSDPGKPFPIGTGATQWAPDLGTLDFSRLACAKLAVVLGENEDKNHQNAVEAFVTDVRTFAKSHGLDCGVVDIRVPDGGHYSVTNYVAARDFLFADLSQRRVRRDGAE